VHCALFAALTFAGLAALFLQLNAQFVGLAQVLVYVGAVAILVLFAMLLTRGSETPSERPASASWGTGVTVASVVCLTLSAAVILSANHAGPAVPKPDVSSDVAVRQIGGQLMTNYVLPLEIVALLLTAATIGAVVIAMNEKDEKS
jgi:NADH-quinone oxidoreductase subunit J